MLRALVTLTLASVALAGCSGTAPDPHPDAAPGCPAVELIGIRGQGQSLSANDGLGTEVATISALLEDELTGPVRITAIRHPGRLGSAREYLEDVADGRSLLRSRMRTVVEDCPDTSIAVIGFSQGSQIAREELAARPALARHVDALILVGSPVRDPSSPFHHVELTGGIPTAAGRLGPGPDLGDLGTRTVEACIAGDAVCAADRLTDDTIHRRAYEEPAVARAIAAAAADVLALRTASS